MKYISKIFYHGAAILSAMLATLFILDMLNPNMNFLDGIASKVFLVIFCIVSAGAGICGIISQFREEE